MCLNLLEIGDIIEASETFIVGGSMELSQVRYFVAAAQFQNLSKAARVLNITQPALSKSITKLEDELGVMLFDRLGKSVALNEYGERFLDYAINSLKELDDAVVAVKYKASNPVLHLGLLVHSDKFMRCLAGFSSANPTVSFRLEHLEHTAHNVDTNVFDMLLYPQNHLQSKFKGDIAYSDPFVMVVHEANPIAQRESVRLIDAASQRIIFIDHNNRVYDLPYHLCVSLDFHISDCIYTNSYEMQRWLVANNIGICFLPQGAAGIFSADSNVVSIPVEDEDFKQSIMIGFKRDKHLSIIGKEFAAYVSNYFMLT